MELKQDISDRKDIELLVDRFYKIVQNDEVIGYLFNEVAKTNWNIHIPKMYDFWEVVLFGTGGFKGNPMQVHKELHRKSKMNETHFKHWIHLFNSTVDELFTGPNTEDVKYSAANIAKSLMCNIMFIG